jgi:hypothetical protein
MTVLAFDASFQEFRWITVDYLRAIVTLMGSVGPLGDITGRRPSKPPRLPRSQ